MLSFHPLCRYATNALPLRRKRHAVTPQTQRRYGAIATPLRRNGTRQRHDGITPRANGHSSLRPFVSLNLNEKNTKPTAHTAE